MSRDSSVTEVSHLQREQLVEVLLASPCRRKIQLVAAYFQLVNRKLVLRCLSQGFLSLLLKQIAQRLS